MQPGWILVNVSNVKGFDVIFNLANIKPEQLFHLRGLCNSRVSLRPLHKKNTISISFLQVSKDSQVSYAVFSYSRKSTWGSLTKWTLWTNWRWRVSLSTTPSSRRSRKCTASTPSSPNSRSIRASFSATQRSEWNCWPRRSLTSATAATTFTPGWRKTTGDALDYASISEVLDILLSLFRWSFFHSSSPFDYTQVGI